MRHIYAHANENAKEEAKNKMPKIKLKLNERKHGK
jgi:hypothetical protein